MVHREVAEVALCVEVLHEVGEVVDEECNTFAPRVALFHIIIVIFLSTGTYNRYMHQYNTIHAYGVYV